MVDKIETGTIILGSAIGIANIESILGIIILVVQLALIIYKFILKIIDKVKLKKYNEIVEDTKDLIDELEQLDNKAKETKDNGKQD